MRWKNLQFLKKVKSKKVISIVLVFIVSFCAILAKPTKPTKTYVDEVSNIKIEMTNQNIDNKGVDKMRSEFVTINGKTYQAKKVTMRCTAYTSAPNEGGAYAYNGQKLRDGMVAADLKLYPIGTKIFIPKLNKVFTVTDTGSAIRNQRLDIWMNSKQKALNWGVQTLDVYILN